MLKLIFLTTILFLGSFMTVQAQDPEDLILDTKCNNYRVLLRDNQMSPVCNTYCRFACLNDGKHCVYGSTTECPLTDADLESLYSGVPLDAEKAFNIFGVELCPDPDTRPDDDPYCLVNLIRLGFYAVISLFVFILVLMGLWVAWVRSTAADSPEKVEKAATIARNAITGALITFLFVVIVQVVSLLVGLTGNIFDISLVPQPKELSYGDPCDSGYVQCPGGTVCRDTGNGAVCSTP